LAAARDDIRQRVDLIEKHRVEVQMRIDELQRLERDRAALCGIG
jgi:hypothetical protein